MPMLLAHVLADVQPAPVRARMAAHINYKNNSIQHPDSLDYSAK